ncbi:MAG: transposase [Clostridia bacterium]|nr:transposase [Clostridia bacterium]
MDELQTRKEIRLKDYDYSSVGSYFLTVCTKERKNYFWKDVGTTIGRPQEVNLSPCGRIVDDAINNISKIYHSVTVDHYVIMPDHIHVLLTIHADDCGRPMVAPTTDRMIKQMKGYVSKQIGHSIWQKRFADHVIRNRDDYNEHVKYISDNPMRWYYNHLQ